MTMSDGAATAYDVVPYPNWPTAHSNPATLGALAQLLGRPAAPADKCRVLEIACNEGTNIASMAAAAPGSEFVGIDLAAGAIERGRKTLALAGLVNVSLHCCDIAEPAAIEGEFDYIVAHGIYSWTGEIVRKAILRVMGQRLTAHGIAFLSYNAFPGCRLRQTLRDYLARMVDGVDDRRERIEKARWALEYQIGGWSEDVPFQKALIETAQSTLERPPEVLFHDEMATIWEPQFLDAVVAAARPEGLAYLADALPASVRDCLFESARFDAARRFTGGDWARYEQLLDFTDMRAFRWSLLVRDGAPIDRLATPDRVRGLWASAALTRVEPRPDQKAHVFRATDKVEFETDDSDLAALFDALSSAAATPLDGIAHRADLVEAALRLYVNGVVTLSNAPPAYSLTPGERPLASPLSRAQAAQGERVLAALHHKPVRMDDPFWYRFLQELDGVNDRAALARFVSAQTGKSADEARILAPRALEEFARLRLLMA
ncbi:class I SAM-dependent methyltransferase [Rhodoblastus acidophilus]|uniref:Class I SAM-dependent methyltransferase n=1 Tax=Candidatus Rhodoblastus alkanivorans TaxID=2954117 RepID=A0ABS9Z7W2_9HYPH|nr:class I SAM-dependent methyltransferase [Candidatus Rhodoblastus alkanivorans]MCI4678268.1 class I SAM-dependent methyltransferase [Candidatus Rhodoblastus alkanivorans]MCI4683526.1 class I SAM-dependent methyltransferase [Candidatus Rhodoblastus alkanivorans]MDI4640841.1 class I SAM-dependent methyltransferase [Rhodoblastus acidophilus]